MVVIQRLFSPEAQSMIQTSLHSPVQGLGMCAWEKGADPIRATSTRRTLPAAMDDPEDIAYYYPQMKKLKSSSEDPSSCSLPFYLQDLCLLVVINDLGSYSTELLASLPYWLRHRLLDASLPSISFVWKVHLLLKE